MYTLQTLQPRTQSSSSSCPSTNKPCHGSRQLRQRKFHVPDSSSSLSCSSCKCSGLLNTHGKVNQSTSALADCRWQSISTTNVHCSPTLDHKHHKCKDASMISFAAASNVLHEKTQDNSIALSVLMQHLMCQEKFIFQCSEVRHVLENQSLISIQLILKHLCVLLHRDSR